MTVRFKIRADTVHIPGVGVLTKTGSDYWSDWITTDAPAELLKPFEHAAPDSPERARMPGKVAYVEPVVDVSRVLRENVKLIEAMTNTTVTSIDGAPVDVFDEDTPAVPAQPKKRSKR